MVHVAAKHPHTSGDEARLGKGLGSFDFVCMPPLDICHRPAYWSVLSVSCRVASIVEALSVILEFFIAEFQQQRCDCCVLQQV